MKRCTLLICLPVMLLVLASCNRSPRAQAQSNVDNGNKFFAKNNYKAAALMYRKAFAKDPLFGEAYYRMALADLQLGALGEAVGMLRRAVDLQPDNTDAKVQLANIYLFASTKDTKNSAQLIEEAGGLIEKILAKDPNSLDGHRLSGQMALLKNDTKTAVAELQTANQLKPAQSEVVLLLMEALVRDKQEPAAEKLARDFISQDKTFAQTYDRLYIPYMNERRRNDAEEILKLKTENKDRKST